LNARTPISPCKVRDRVRHAPGLQGVGHCCCEAHALEGVALLQLGAGRDGCLQAGAELAVHRAHRVRRPLEPGRDRLERAGGLRRLGDPLGQQPAQHFLPRHEEFALVGEVPEEGALGDPGALSDLRDRRGVVALLGEQVCSS